MTPDQRKDAAASILEEALLKIHGLCVEVEVTVAADENYTGYLVARCDKPEQVAEMYNLEFIPYAPESVGRKESELSEGAALARETPLPSLTPVASYANALATLEHAILSGIVKSRTLMAGAPADRLRKAVLESVTAAPYRWCLKQIGETPP